MKRKQKSVTVFDRQFESIQDALVFYGIPPLNGANRRLAHSCDVSPSLAIEILVLLREEKEVTHELRKMEKRQKALLRERRKLRALLSAPTPYSPVGICCMCGAFGRMKRHSSPACDNCRDAYRLTCNAEIRRKRRKLYPREKKLKHKHKRYGTKYDKTITAESVAEAYGHRCCICKCRVERHKGQGYQPRGWTIGHIVPMVLGGNTTWDNVQCECIECNTIKNSMNISNMAARKLVRAYHSRRAAIV